MNKLIWTSWNGNITHKYSRLYEPTTEEEIRKIVKNSKNIRVFGTNQSSSDIVAGTDILISLHKYNKILSINKKRREITVQSGIILAKLLKKINKLGWSLPTLPDVDTITLGGAIATGTHGTGRDANLLSGYMTACTLITASGELKKITEKSELMDAVKVSLGLLGIMSTIIIRCEPVSYFDIVEQPIKDDVWLKTFRKELKNNFFLRLIWLPHTGYGYMIKANKQKRSLLKVNMPPWYIKYRRKASVFLYKHLVKYPQFIPYVNQLIKNIFFNHIHNHFGTLYEETVTKTRSGTMELAEWTVSVDKFKQCFDELRKKLQSPENKVFIHIPMDTRFIQKDKSWLSYAYDTDIITMGCVTRTPKYAKEYKAFKMVEEIFRKYGGRPHWGKIHSYTAQDFRKVYPKWNDFINLRREMDPSGKFLNQYLKRIFA